MAETKCPRCGGVVECVCVAGGRNGQVDRFYSICLGCGFYRAASFIIGEPGELFCGFEEGYPLCPFCHKSYRQHRPSEEFFCTFCKQYHLLTKLRKNPQESGVNMYICAKANRAIAWQKPGQPVFPILYTPAGL